MFRHGNEKLPEYLYNYFVVVEKERRKNILLGRIIIYVSKRQVLKKSFALIFDRKL